MSCGAAKAFSDPLIKMTIPPYILTLPFLTLNNAEHNLYTHSPRLIYNIILI